jgi:vancomycin resistance protein YoaR
MKRLYYFILAVFFLSLLGANFCLAESSKVSDIVSLQVGNYVQTLSQKEIDSLVQEKSGLAYSPGYSSEIENINFCQYNKSILCNLLFSIKDSYHLKKTTQRLVDEKKINDFLTDLERKVNKDPENAKLKFDNDRVSAFSAGTNGLKLDKEKSFEILKNFLSQTNSTNKINLAFSEIQPEISLDSIDNMGITSLIGEGRSNFKGSPKNRVFNIKVAIERFNGVLIKPGEEFSFVKILGDVDGEHGYLPELVIKKDKTEPEFGGGICQVSTTTFRAAIYSGLDITARRNHAYPVAYYNPQGMDSTVYIPRPDLRFINNTPGYILIQPRIEGTELIFSFYGKDDGRKINIIGPRITERNPDGSMKATFTQQVYNKDGKIILEDVFNSSYDSPSKYPHPGETLTQKPDDWSQKQWDTYQKNSKP